MRRGFKNGVKLESVSRVRRSLSGIFEKFLSNNSFLNIKLGYRTVKE